MDLKYIRLDDASRPPHSVAQILWRSFFGEQRDGTKTSRRRVRDTTAETKHLSREFLPPAVSRIGGLLCRKPESRSRHYQPKLPQYLRQSELRRLIAGTTRGLQTVGRPRFLPCSFPRITGVPRMPGDDLTQKLLVVLQGPYRTSFSHAAPCPSVRVDGGSHRLRP